MSQVFNKYLSELEEYNKNLKKLDLSTTEGLKAFISDAYNLYINGNFLIINAFANGVKILYESSGVKDIIDLALNMYLSGPTKILDLDYDDQKDFILNKANFLTYYTLNVDSSYKDKALKELSLYANMFTDGKHLYSKALLEKPSNPEDSQSLNKYKNYLLEYFIYGNELNDEELTLLGIDKNLLSLTIKELELKVKKYKNEPQTLKSIYYVLLNKGELKYAYPLSKIDKVFGLTMDYYLSRRRNYSFEEDLNNNSLTNDNKTFKNKIKQKKKSNKWFVLTILLVIIKYSLWYDSTMEQTPYITTLYITTIALPIVLLALRFITQSKLLNIIFSILLLLLTIYYIYNYNFNLSIEVRDILNNLVSIKAIVNDLVIIGLIISNIKGFTNTYKL